MNFSAKHAAIMLALGAGAAYLAQGRGPLSSPKAPPLPYVDTEGRSGMLAAPAKPTLVVLWIDNCAYCERSMKVLDRVRRLYAESDVDIVGFYLNNAENAAIERMARGRGHMFPVAKGQSSGDYVSALTDGFGFRGTGRQIFVVGKNGRYDEVDASDLRAPDYDVLQRVRSILLNKYRLKERA